MMDSESGSTSSGANDIPSNLPNSESGSTSSGANDWASLSLLFPHASIRHDIIQLQRCATALTTLPTPPNINKRIKSFKCWWRKYHIRRVSMHHECEELIYFPWMETKCSLPSTLQQLHVALHRMTDTIDKLLSKSSLALAFSSEEVGKTSLDESFWASSSTLLFFVSELAQALNEYAAAMTRHLDDEEAIVPNLLRLHFTPEEEKKIVKKIQKKCGVVGARLFLPGMLLEAETETETGSGITKAEFKQNVPKVIRWVNRKVWKKRYKSECILVNQLARL